MGSREGEPQTLYVGPGGEFSSIQEAMGHASDGDTIVLENGSYRENIVSDTFVRIQGNSTANCIIQGNSSDTENDTVVSGPFALSGLSVHPENYDPGRDVTAVALVYDHPETIPEDLVPVMVSAVAIRNASTGLLIEAGDGNAPSPGGLVLLEKVRISDCDTGLYLDRVNGTRITGSDFEGNDVGVHLENAFGTSIELTSFVPAHKGESINEGTGITGQDSGRTRVDSCIFWNLSRGLVLGDGANVTRNKFIGNDQGIRIGNGSRNAIFSNTFNSTEGYDINITGNQSVDNTMGRNQFYMVHNGSLLLRNPRIMVEEGLDFFQQDFLNVHVFRADGFVITGADVKIVNQEDGTVYATPYYGGTNGTTTDPGGIGDRLVTMGVWHGDTSFSFVTSTVTVHNDRWEETKVFPTDPGAQSSPVLFWHPPNMDVTVNASAIWIVDHNKENGSGTIRFWVDNLDIGEGEVLVEVYVLSLENDTEEEVYSKRIYLGIKDNEGIDIVHVFEEGDYQVKIVLNSDGAAYEANTSNNVITSDVFSLEREEESPFSDIVLYIGAGAFLVLIFAFFGILFFAYMKAGEEVEKEEGRDRAGKRARKVLVAYEELEIRISLKRELEQEGYEVTLAKTGFEFLDLMKKERFDALVYSGLLSDMSLRDLISRIEDEHTGIPLVVLQEGDEELPGDVTGLSFSGTGEEMKALGKKLKGLIPKGGTGIIFACAGCEAKLRARKPGAVKCPKCGEINHPGEGEKETPEEFIRYFTVVDRLLGKVSTEGKLTFKKSELFRLYVEAATKKKSRLTVKEKQRLVSGIDALLEEHLDPKALDEFREHEDYALYERVLGRYSEEEEQAEVITPPEEEKTAGKEEAGEKPADKEEAGEKPTGTEESDEKPADTKEEREKESELSGFYSKEL